MHAQSVFQHNEHNGMNHNETSHYSTVNVAKSENCCFVRLNHILSISFSESRSENKFTTHALCILYFRPSKEQFMLILQLYRYTVPAITQAFIISRDELLCSFLVCALVLCCQLSCHMFPICDYFYVFGCQDFASSLKTDDNRCVTYASDIITSNNMLFRYEL